MTQHKLNILALDVNWLTHRYYYVAEKRHSVEKIPAVIADMIIRWCYEYATVHKAHHVICGIDGGDNFRKHVLGSYKVSRAVHVNEDGTTMTADEVKEFREAGGVFVTAPDPMQDARAETKRLLKELGIPFAHMRRYEADDILSSMEGWVAAYNVKLEPKQHRAHVIMATPDKDAVQSVNGHCSQWIPGPSGKPGVWIREDNIAERIKHITKSTRAVGWTANMFLDYQILTGDATDDVPPLIPKAKAVTLLNKYRTLEDIVASWASEVQDAPPPSPDVLKRNRLLVTMKRDLLDGYALDQFAIPHMQRMSPSLHRLTIQAYERWAAMPKHGPKLSLFS